MKKTLAIIGTLTLCLIALGLGVWSVTGDNGNTEKPETHSDEIDYPVTTSTVAPILIPPTSIARTTTTVKRTTTTTAQAKTTDTTTPNMPPEPTEQQKNIPDVTTTTCPMECKGMSEDACNGERCLAN